MRIKKSEPNATIETEAQEAVAESPVVEPTSQVKSFTVEHDDEAGTVSFELADGTAVVLREPKAKQFLMVQSWIRKQPDEDLRSDEFAMLRLAHAASTGLPDWNTFLDNLEPEDMLRVVRAIGFFRDSIERFSRTAAQLQPAR